MYPVFIHGQPEWSPGALKNRCHISNQKVIVKVLKMIVDNDIIEFHLVFWK